MIKVKRIREEQSEWIKEKREYHIGLGWIRENRYDCSKRIRPNRAERMRERRAERRIFHSEILREVDNR